LKKSRLIYMAVLALALVPASACSMPWSWDMFEQPSMKAQEAPAPPPVPDGTVTTEGRPFYAKDRGDSAKLVNPVTPTRQSLELGKAAYETYCATCHGETGLGDGPVGKKYITPTNLSSAYVQDKPDGDIYYTITYGGLAIMPSYADSVPVIERWHIVNYIKQVFGGSVELTRGE